MQFYTPVHKLKNYSKANGEIWVILQDLTVLNVKRIGLFLLTIISTQCWSAETPNREAELLSNIEAEFFW